ncbi:hypothetical protein [Marinobacter sp.]|uniref:hypothetical protein n=1 Tax=Marinobacter sp. TaxID=50741 RepID=UPI003A907919
MPRNSASPPTSHDQNFKNLILDYPIQAINLFSPQESEAILPRPTNNWKYG